MLGQVSTDVFGNPLCTTYVRPTRAVRTDIEWVDGGPVVAQVGNGCYSDANGILTIPNLGTDRYTLSVIAPDGQKWIQTTTLEGNHDWDVWPMEGDTGLDTEFAVGAEPVPIAIFGFVPEPTATMTGTGLPAADSARPPAPAVSSRRSAGALLPSPVVPARSRAWSTRCSTTRPSTTTPWAGSACTRAASSPDRSTGRGS